MNLDDLTIEEVRAIQITDIRARLAARTPGSWLATLDNDGWCINSVLDEGTPKERMETLARLNSGSPSSDTSDACFIASAADDIGVLLAEVERLTNDLAMARQVSGELCEKCGWAMKFPGEPCRCALLDEVERLTTLLAGTEAVLENEREYQTRLKAEVGQLANESFRRGAEAMRTALLQRVSWGSDLADRIRGEPVPEDK
jgi:hypothetical protein